MSAFHEQIPLYSSAQQSLCPDRDPGHAPAESVLSQAILGKRNSIYCVIQDRIPIVRNHVGDHYVSGPGGHPMLVVKRRTGQQIQINGPVELTVLDAQDDCLKLGIECFRDASADVEPWDDSRGKP